MTDALQSSIDAILGKVTSGSPRVAGVVAMCRPSRMTVMVSQMAATSSSLCEMYTQVTPLAFNVRMISSSTAVST